jgi:hypothetical protein
MSDLSQRTGNRPATLTGVDGCHELDLALARYSTATTGHDSGTYTHDIEERASFSGQRAHANWCSQPAHGEEESDDAVSIRDSGAAPA